MNEMNDYQVKSEEVPKKFLAGGAKLKKTTFFCQKGKLRNPYFKRRFNKKN